MITAAICTAEASRKRSGLDRAPGTLAVGLLEQLDQDHGRQKEGEGRVGSEPARARSPSSARTR